jgi:hypothetical protein
MSKVHSDRVFGNHNRLIPAIPPDAPGRDQKPFAICS